MPTSSTGMFRPGRGSGISIFTSAVAEETVYPGDWVALSTTAPSGQGPGADGVFVGKTLLSSDFIYAVLTDTDGTPGTNGLQMGVCMGQTIGGVRNFSVVTSDSIAADNLFVIQKWGVHPGGRVDTSTDVGDQVTQGTVAGRGDTETIGVNLGFDNFMGMVLTEEVTTSRASASDTRQSVVMVRCNR